MPTKAQLEGPSTQPHERLGKWQGRKLGNKGPRTTAQDILNETAIYGGIPLRRADIYTLALQDTNGDSVAADILAFGTRAVTDCEPWSIDDARRIFRQEERARLGNCHLQSDILNNR